MKPFKLKKKKLERIIRIKASYSSHFPTTKAEGDDHGNPRSLGKSVLSSSRGKGADTERVSCALAGIHLGCADTSAVTK